MTMKRLLCGALLLLLAAPAGAQDRDPLQEHFFPPELVMQHQRTIKLTAAQKETIKTAVQTAQATFTNAQWELQDAMQSMAELVSGQRVDEAQALDQLETILDLERQIKRAQLTLMIRLKNTLTEQQQLSLKIARDWDDDTHDDGLWPW